MSSSVYRDMLISRPLPDGSGGPQHLTDPPSSASGQFWLQGEALMCACPDCGAPMSVRHWLMMADCWCCGASIELTEEQEREVQRLLAQRPVVEEVRKATVTPVTPRPHTGPVLASDLSRIPSREPHPPTGTRVDQVAARQPGGHRPRPVEGPTPPSHAPAVSRQPDRTERRTTGGAPRPPAPPRSAPRPPRHAGEHLHAVIRATPAWLISLVIHLLVLLLLAVLTFQREPEDEFITLTTAISRHPHEAGESSSVEIASTLNFDLPVPPDVDLNDEAERESVVRADQDARELRIDASSTDPNLPDLASVQRQLTASRNTATFAARDPRLRAQIVTQEGGTTLTEAAVARGLRWLDSHQNRDGSWSLHEFDHAPGCTCEGRGLVSDSAGTSLALLPFLGAGQTHLVGRYQDTVSKGLRWLIERQKDDGDLRAGSLSNAGMYAHGQASIVLCEAFAMSGDERLRKPAQKSIDFIVDAQHEGGGWRYAPGQPGDTSVFGWQVMALQSARTAGLHVPRETLALAENYLDDVAHERGALYAYQPRQGPTHVMTAEALLCRAYLGWTIDRPPLLRGARYLNERASPSAREPNIYYWYYGTQFMHHLGGEDWVRWNQKMRDILVESQEKKGHEAGSWDPRGPHAEAGGRIYMTALAVCTLEVYYRHLPIFRQLDLEPPKSPAR